MMEEIQKLDFENSSKIVFELVKSSLALGREDEARGIIQMALINASKGINEIETILLVREVP